jgi:hypothetical protein
MLGMDVIAFVSNASVFLDVGELGLTFSSPKSIVSQETKMKEKINVKTPILLIKFFIL